MTPSGYTEDELVEQPAIALLAELGWETFNAYGEFDHGQSTLERETRAEVVLKSRLRPVMPGIVLIDVVMSGLDRAASGDAAL